jgi:N-acetylglucosaminyl-diphospho-decaprenol L-rhamnosyltransferase
MWRNAPIVIELTYGIVNTNGRPLLEQCLAAIDRERRTLPLRTEVLVVDNASTDDSVDAARRLGATVLELTQRQGKAANDTLLLQRAAGRFVLLLNEDSELRPGATAALVDALLEWPGAAAAGAQLRYPDGRAQGSAYRFPTPATTLRCAIGLAGTTVQSGTRSEPHEVDWHHSAALLVRRDAAAQVGWLDPDFFVYSDEVDFARRLRDADWSIVHVPAAECVHHEQLANGGSADRRIVEFARNRDRYMRKHHSRAAARAVRWLSALTYLQRACAAVVLPGHSPRRYWRHVRASLRPGVGDGLAEAAAAFNAQRAAAALALPAGPPVPAATPAPPAAPTPSPAATAR